VTGLELPSIERSREEILEAIGSPADLTLVPGARGIGDELVAAGVRRLLAGAAYRELDLAELCGASGDTALFAGGGAFCRPHIALTSRSLAVAEMRFKRVIVLPSWLDADDDDVRRALVRTTATIFCSEPGSQERIASLCDTRLAHDCAFYFDFTSYVQSGSGVLNAFRSDGGDTFPLPPDNDDISLTTPDLAAWLSAIAAHELVRTDRVHVMIAAALMGKRVQYPPSRHDALDSMAEEVLGGYRVARIDEKPRGDVRPQPAALDPAGQQTLHQLRETALAMPAPHPSGRSPVPRITAVVLTRDRPRLARRALDSLELSETPLRVLVIDNNSAHAAARDLDAECAARANAQLVHADRNLGCAGGRQLGSRLADSELVLFLDDDAELLPGALEHMLAELDAHPDAGAVSATVVTAEGIVSHSGGSIELTDEIASFGLIGADLPFTHAALPPSGPAGWAPGTAILVRRKLLEEFPIDERMSAYFEDNEWCYRVSLTRPGSFRRSREALALHHLTPKQIQGPSFPARSISVELLDAQARFYERHRVLMGPSLFYLVPELRAGDGTCDLAGARVLMELVTAKGTDWTLMAWMNGELAGLLTAHRRQTDLRAAEDALERAGAENARLEQAVSSQEETIASQEKAIALQHSSHGALCRELEQTRAENVRLEQAVSSQEETMAFLHSRHDTLCRVEQGGWWRLRGHLLPVLRLGGWLRALRR